MCLYQTLNGIRIRICVGAVYKHILYIFMSTDPYTDIEDVNVQLIFNNFENGS